MEIEYKVYVEQLLKSQFSFAKETFRVYLLFKIKFQITRMIDHSNLTPALS